MPTNETQEPSGTACEPNQVSKAKLLTCSCLSNAALASGGVLPALCLVQISERFQLTDSQCGLFFAVGPTVTLITLPVFGQLSERWGKRIILLLGMVLLAVAMACYRSADHYYILLLGSLALGLSCAIVDALISPLLLDLFPTDHGNGSAAIMNLVHCCFQVGIVGTALVAGFYLARGGLWNDTFLPILVLGIVLAIFYGLTRFPPALEHASPIRMGGLLSQKSFWLCAIVIAVSGGVEAGILGWVSTFLQRQFTLSSTGDWLTERFGLTDPKPLLGGIGIALFAAPMVVGRWFYGSLADRWGYVTIMMASCAVSVVSLLGLWQAATANASIGWLALLGLALSGVWPTLLVYSGTIIRANPQTLFSMLAMAGLAGVSICSWAIGQLAEYFGNVQIGLCSLIVPLVAAMGALWRLRVDRGQ